MQIEINNIEQLRYFAEQLEELRQVLRQQRLERVASADEIRSKWNDTTYLSHRRNLDQMLEEVEGFESDCDILGDYLRRLYQAGMDVLQS